MVERITAITVVLKKIPFTRIGGRVDWYLRNKL